MHPADARPAAGWDASQRFHMLVIFYILGFFTYLLHVHTVQLTRLLFLQADSAGIQVSSFEQI